MYLIYYLNLFYYYSLSSFNNLCSHIKLQSYDAIKLNITEIIEINLKDIQLICENHNLVLIISFNNCNKINKFVDQIKNIEIFESEEYNNYKDKFDCIILNISIKNVNDNVICNLDKKDKLLINDPDNIQEYNFLKNNKNIGIETKNNYDIWYTMLNIKIISFIHETNILNNEWSIVNNYNNTLKSNISYKCVEYINTYKKIIITGITGQDGSLLAEYLLSLDKKFIIIGTIKSVSVLKHDNLKNIINNKYLCPFILDLCDDYNTELIIKNIKPDYFFNCAAESLVYNINQEKYENTFMINTIAPLRQLEYINKYCNKCRYLSCGSSEEFGEIKYAPQDLNHPYNPVNIYGITKNTTNNLVKFYREKYKLYCCHLILYNHESPRRNINFFTRKVTSEIARIKIEIDNNQIPTPMKIGNIYSKRDWSSCDDFIKCFWKIMNMEYPEDYLLSSGKTHTVKEVIDIGFKYINIQLRWEIKKNVLETKAYYNDLLIIEINPLYYRNFDENNYFHGDNSKTKKKLNWENMTDLEELIGEMIYNDLSILNIKQNI